MKMFCIRKNICSQRKKNPLFLPCNMAAVQKTSIHRYLIIRWRQPNLSLRLLNYTWKKLQQCFSNTCFHYILTNQRCISNKFPNKKIMTTLARPCTAFPRPHASILFANVTGMSDWPFLRPRDPKRIVRGENGSLGTRQITTHETLPIKDSLLESRLKNSRVRYFLPLKTWKENVSA